MLDSVSCNPRPVSMPVDYAAYLLSSSPPGAGFQFLSKAYSGDCPITIHSSGLKQFSCFTSPTNNHHRSQRLAPLKPIIVVKTDNCEFDKSNNADEDSNGFNKFSCLKPTPPTSPDGKTKKKVSFADHRGCALATVRIMTEPSDVPPRIRPEILSALTKGASAGVTDKCPLSLNFAQPASNYLQFRDKLDKNCVSLENVILKDYCMMGTIKVKNLSFKKNVFVRVTFDSWETSTDLPAVYSPNSAESHNIFDTFTFEVNVPTNYNPRKKVMFAVCYESDGKQFWDSNDGNNYQVVSNESVPVPGPSALRHSVMVPKKEEENVWTQYACWQHVDTSIPYW